jgi:hypothetical protein
MLYVFGGDGQVWFGSAATLTLTATLSLTSTYTYLHRTDGPRSKDVPFEMFVVSGDFGEFEHYDGHRWTRIDPGHRSSQNNRVGVVWLGPGEAIATGTHEDDSVLHYKNGTITMTNAGLPITAAQWIDGYGAVLGTSLGSLLRFKPDESFEILLDAATLDLPLYEVRGIAPLLGGILFGDKNGALIELQPGIPSCSNIGATIGAGVLETLVPQRNDFAFAGSHSAPDEVLLSRQPYSPPKPLSCPR